jgi:hypothetical protein
LRNFAAKQQIDRFQKGIGNQAKLRLQNPVHEYDREPYPLPSADAGRQTRSRRSTSVTP